MDPPRALRLGGGKAAGLARLVRAGLPVPEGFVLPPEIMGQHLRRHGLLDAAQRGEDIQAPLLGSALSRGLRRELEASARALVGSADVLLAVRSSALHEDGAKESHAGQYLSLLGIRPGEELEGAVLRCWASAGSAHALAYRRAHGQPAGTVEMALLVQRLVEPRCAGVLFTVNPATGSWAEMTVEAAWGQGEAVVSGRVVPEHHRLRRPRWTPRPLLALPLGRGLVPIESLPADQDHELVVDRARARPALVARPLPEARRRQPILSPAELRRLGRLGLRVEARLGGPVDLEWAIDEAGRVHLTQARPVTAGVDVRRSGPTLWSRRFLGERWTRPASPLGWSLMRELLEWFIAYPETSRRHLGGDPPTRLLRCTPYVNVTVFRHLAFKAPGFSPPRFLIELLPPDEERRWLRRRDQAPDLRVYASILAETARERRWQRFRWNLFTNDRAWAAFLPTLDGRLAELGRPIRGRAEALAHTVAAAALAREYVKIHVCSLLFANIWFEAATAALERHLPPEEVALALRPARPSATVHLHQDLAALGRGQLDLDAFLARHGHRADGSWELFNPRFREEPGQALALARAAAARPEVQPPPVPALSSLPASARPLVGLARRYLALREDQREVFDRIAWQWKRAWLWLEEEQELPLRFLEQGEVRSLLDGELPRPDALALIERRRAAQREEEARRARGDEPPDFLLGEDEAIAQEPDLAMLEGLPVSIGVATGPARVLRTLGDAHRLRPGDILVARATDPAWTPLFLNAHGLVLESGGMLAHGAVLARELRLPAVTQVREATRRVRDGQTITVDGRRGRVWLR